jgi:hypothetical protein
MDYSTTKIYKIESHLGDKIYIGSTTIKYLSQRMQQHICHYKRWKSENLVQKITSFELFDEYGIDNCKIALIEEYPCTSKDAKNAREGHFIKTIPCVNKRIEGRKKGEYYKDNKQIICQKQLIYRGEHKEQIKKYYEDHKEELLSYHKKYYDENKDHLIQYQKEYNNKNAEGNSYTEKIKQYQKTYRAKRRAQQKLKRENTSQEPIIETISQAPIIETISQEQNISNISKISTLIFLEVMLLILKMISARTQEAKKETPIKENRPPLKFNY